MVAGFKLLNCTKSSVECTAFKGPGHQLGTCGHLQLTLGSNGLHVVLGGLDTWPVRDEEVLWVHKVRVHFA